MNEWVICFWIGLALLVVSFFLARLWRSRRQ